MRLLFSIFILVAIVFSGCKSDEVEENIEEVFSLKKGYAYVGEIYAVNLVPSQTGNKYQGVLGESALS